MICQYKIDKTNNDGTHKLKATYTCSLCKEKIILYKTEQCNLSSWSYNPTTKYEERVCSDCGYKEIRTHVHDQVPSNLVYTLDKTNDDGTHKLKATYTCSVCRETITLYKTENCNYGSWEQNNGFTCSKECTVCGHEETKNHGFQVKPNSVTSNSTVGLHNVVEKCSDCGYEKQVQANCTGDGNKYFYQNDGNKKRSRNRYI